MNKVAVVMLSVVALVCSSCDNSPKLYPVSGKVTYKGAPAAGATVFLQRQGADPLMEQTIMGIVQKDGSFTLVCGPQGSGAPAGDYDVLIEWKPRSNHGKGLAQSVSDRLKGRYADPKHPRMHAVIKAGANDLPPFELTD
jgi:hypothetical protein